MEDEEIEKMIALAGYIPEEPTLYVKTSYPNPTTKKSSDVKKDYDDPYEEIINYV